MKMAECRRNCWWIAVGGGALLFILLAALALFPLLKSFLIGALFAFVMGLFLTWAFCSEPKTGAQKVGQTAEETGGEAVGAPWAAQPAGTATPNAAAAPVAPAQTSGTPAKAAMPELSPARPVSPPEQAAAPRPVGAPQTASALDAALEKSRSVAPEPGKPEMLAAPRGGVPDDLKRIKGVGPKLEALLNEVGVWHFDQIASWKARDIAFVDEKMGSFRGRITRDGWVKQARLLSRQDEDVRM